MMTRRKVETVVEGHGKAGENEEAEKKKSKVTRD